MSRRSATDGLSGPSTQPCTVTGYSTAVGPHTLMFAATDVAGNTSTRTRSYTVTDATPPVITPTLSGTVGQGGWYTSDVALSWLTADPESPVDARMGCDPVSVTADTAGVGFTCRATSAGGTAENSVTINRDATAPTLSISGGPADTGSYAFGSVPAAPLCTAADATAGPRTQPCTVSGYSTAVGAHTLTFTATDAAGNAATVTRSYTVTPWRLSGFYQPVDGGGIVNIVKGGAKVPLKFEVFVGATELTDPASIGATLTATPSACTGGATDDVEAVTTNPTGLRYDAATGQFVLTWQTPKKPGTCYTLTLTTADGSTLSALFQLK